MSEQNLPQQPAESSIDSRIDPNHLGLYGTAFGLALIGIAVLWTAVLRNRPIDWFPRDQWALDLVLGGIVGSIFALLTWTLAHMLPSLRYLKNRLLHTLDMDALRPAHIVLFGLIAGLPEEILFRGAMQPVLGWVITSLIFGALHGITPTYFVYATSAGAMLSGLTIWRGGLWAPVAAHAAIDMIMFFLLLRDWGRHNSAKG